MAPPRDFEWDENKADANLRKHGVSFLAAARVFQDHAALERIDDRENYGEERWTAIGDVGGRLHHCGAYLSRRRQHHQDHFRTFLRQEGSA